MALGTAAATVFAIAVVCGTAAAAKVVIHDFDHLAIAPDGGRVAAVEADDPGNLPEEPHGHVVVRNAAGKIVASYDPCKVCRYSDTAFAPKADAMAFLASDEKAHKATLFVAGGGKARSVTVIDGVANTVRWSPDGARIALLATIGAHKKTGAVEAGAALVGEIGESNDEQRIAIVPVGGGVLRLVSPADTYIYEFDWMPDGTGFAVTSAKGNGDNNWWIASLDYVDAGSGQMRRIAAPKMQIELPRVSPDGKTVAFIGGLMSDWQSIGGDIYTVPVSGGEPKNLTPNFKGSFRSLAWRGGKIMTGAIVDDRFSIGTVDPASGAVTDSWHQPITARPQGVNDTVAFSADGKVAAIIMEEFNHPFEIALGTDDRPQPITHENGALEKNVSWRTVHWSNEGFKLQGWLVGPKNADPDKKYPMVVIVHGGPSSVYTPHYIAAGGQHGTNFDFAYDLIQKGYFIFYPNDRGSYGQGEAFTRANVKDFGRGDLRDMLAGIDAVEKTAPINDARLGLYGHSYGGWFAMWANTQTNRFKAFVAGAGIANWTSYYGQNGIDKWMIPFFGASIYSDPKVYRDASPIEFIKQARTPTFLYVGERDVECPAPQSQEYWHALQELNVPSKLMIYPGEGHHFHNPAHLEDLRARIVAWYTGYLGQ
ncbi:MAG: S9 family peptidase [Alphaproteobacteria bacterium]|nr:S9 family peptidase [Alphaproteobacteria bacterium]